MRAPGGKKIDPESGCGWDQCVGILYTVPVELYSGEYQRVMVLVVWPLNLARKS